MQNIDNNIDDLFRNAAAHYKPNPGDSDWADIAPRLISRQDDSAIPVITSFVPFSTNNRSKRNSLLLLFLLSSIALLLSLYLTDKNDKVIVADNHSLRLKNRAENSDLPTVAGKKIILICGNKITENKVQPLPFINKNTNSDIIGSSGTTEENNEVITNNPIVLTTKNIDLLLVLPTEAKTNLLQDKDTGQMQSTIKSNKQISDRQKRFYVGVEAGPSLNEIKQQGFKKTGFDIGLLAGYKIRKKLSAEAGLIYSKKYYFSDGKYFNMDKMPPGMKVLSLSGSSNVFEVPVTIKYNIVQAKKSAVFASAGISSYILTKENNNYITVLNGLQQNMRGSYDKVSAGFASAIHLGAGYERALGKQGGLRIEPFIQIPIKGFGVGNMQVMSTGIHIAVTLPVH